MTDPLFTPLKSHPSTFEAEAKARAAAMAEDQATIDRLRARVEALEAALQVDPWQVGFAHWKALRARAALQQEGGE